MLASGGSVVSVAADDGAGDGELGFITFEFTFPSVSLTTVGVTVLGFISFPILLLISEKVLSSSTDILSGFISIFSPDNASALAISAASKSLLN